MTENNQGARAAHQSGGHRALPPEVDDQVAADVFAGLDLPQLAVLYLQDRLMVAEWTDEGSPRAYRRVSPDPDRRPPTFRQAMATVGAMMSHANEETLADILMGAPEPWLRSWVDEVLLDEGAALLGRVGRRDQR